MRRFVIWGHPGIVGVQSWGLETSPLYSVTSSIGGKPCSGRDQISVMHGRLCLMLSRSIVWLEGRVAEQGRRSRPGSAQGSLLVGSGQDGLCRRLIPGWPCTHFSVSLWP